MLPGKKYSPEDILRLAVRRLWIVALFVGLSTALAFVISKRLPNQFRSETLIMLIPQRIPDSYVKATTTARIEDRLNSLEDQIMSRSRLERIIRDLDLYPGLRRTLPMEDVVQRMRDDIGPIKTEGKESFRLSYVSNDAKTAQKTTERLASLFIEESVRDRENLAEDTSQFLNAQLEDAKRRLVEHEKKLEEYRSRFGGELPSQVTINLQGMQNVQVQLQNLAEATDRARERRLLLERQIADLESDLSTPAVSPTPAPANSSQTPQIVASGSTADQLQAAKTRLTNMLLLYKPEHPEIRAMRRVIRDLEGKLDAERRPATVDASGTSTAPSITDATASPADRLRQQRIKNFKLQLEDIDRELLEKQNQETRLRAVVANYQAKLDAVPKRESDLVELTRDYATLQGTYQSLLAKREEAKLAANLERRNIGEQFKVLDPARVPERPFSPNRIQIIAGGAAAGVVLSLLLIGLLEYRDTSFASEEDVVRAMGIRVLAVIPTMTLDIETRARRLRMALIGTSALVVLVAGAAFAIWRLR